MPTTEQQKKFMCAVCGGTIEAKEGQTLPDKATACEQCRTELKKSVREEVERESPTKKFLFKFATNLASHLPSSTVSEAMRKARASVGGSVSPVIKMNKAEDTNDNKDTNIELEKKTLSDKEHQELHDWMAQRLNTFTKSLDASDVHVDSLLKNISVSNDNKDEDSDEIDECIFASPDE